MVTLEIQFFSPFLAVVTWWKLQSPICFVTILNYFCKDYFPCHVWSLKSLFYCLSGQRFPKMPGTETTLLVSLCRLALSWSTPSMLCQCAYNSASAFTFCLWWAQMPARDASPQSSQDFPEYVSSPRHAHVLSIPWPSQLSNHYTHKNLPSRFPLSQGVGSVCCLPHYAIPRPGQLWVMYLQRFQRMPTRRTGVELGQASEMVPQRTAR